MSRRVTNEQSTRSSSGNSSSSSCGKSGHSGVSSKRLSWDQLLHRKRQTESSSLLTGSLREESRTEGPLPGPQSPSPHRGQNPTNPFHKHESPQHSKSCSALPNDPLTPVSSHRRISFRKLALSPRSDQKNLLSSLHQAAMARELARRERSVIPIQAAVRGFLVRENVLRSPRARPTKEKLRDKLGGAAPGLSSFQSNHTCRSMFSEVTMSEFGESGESDDDEWSIASLDWKRDFDETLHTVLKDHHHPSTPRKTQSLHASTSTPETFMMGDHSTSQFGSFNRMLQDSFSTLKTRESMDAPVRRPRRALSPPPNPLRTRNQLVHNSTNNNYNCGLPMSPARVPPSRTLTVLRSCDDVISPLGNHSPGTGLASKNNKLLLLTRQSKRQLLLESIGNMSLLASSSTTTTKVDEPLQRPRRCHSPLHRRCHSPLRQFNGLEY